MPEHLYRSIQEEKLSKTLNDNHLDGLEDFIDVFPEFKKKVESLLQIDNLDYRFLRSYLTSGCNYSKEIERGFKQGEIITYIDGIITEILSSEEQVSTNERNDNIKAVNKHQRISLLKNRRIVLDIPEVRFLTLYFRLENMDQLDFILISSFLNKYVHGGYSQIFNGIQVLSRTPDRYPHIIRDSCDIKYSNVTGERFKKRLIYFSNPIHFTDGSIIESKKRIIGKEDWMGTSIPIVGKINKEPDIEHVKLDIIYKNRKNLSDIGTISELFKKVLLSIVECELKELKKLT